MKLDKNKTKKGELCILLLIFLKRTNGCNEMEAQLVTKQRLKVNFKSKFDSKSINSPARFEFGNMFMRIFPI